MRLGVKDENTDDIASKYRHLIQKDPQKYTEQRSSDSGSATESEPFNLMVLVLLRQRVILQENLNFGRHLGSDILTRKSQCDPNHTKRE